MICANLLSSCKVEEALFILLPLFFNKNELKSMKKSNSRHLRLVMTITHGNGRHKTRYSIFQKEGRKRQGRSFLLNLGVFWMPAVAKL